MKIEAALFDLDGVLVDTEAQYTDFWKRVGKVYYPGDPDFAVRIKGQALENSISQTARTCRSSCVKTCRRLKLR